MNERSLDILFEHHDIGEKENRKSEKVNPTPPQRKTHSSN
jgi:hypothetical protein